MAESDAAYDTFGLSLSLFPAENFRSLGRVKKRRGCAGLAPAARVQTGLSSDREGVRNSVDLPAWPGVGLAAAARAAMTGSGHVQAEEAKLVSPCSASSGNESNAAD